MNNVPLRYLGNFAVRLVVRCAFLTAGLQTVLLIVNALLRPLLVSPAAKLLARIKLGRRVHPISPECYKTQASVKLVTSVFATLAAPIVTHVPGQA